MVGSTIRPAGKDDVPGILEVWKDADRDFLSWLPQGFGAPMREPWVGDETAERSARLHTLVTEPDRVSRVAVVDGVVRGFLSGGIRRVTDDFFHAPYMYVDHLYVARSYRRKGIGRDLIAEIERWSRSEHMHALDLEVGELNESGRAFYASLGFSGLTRRLAKLLRH